MKKTFKQFIILFFLVGLLILPYFVFAENESSPLKKLQTVAEGGGYAAGTTETSFSQFLGTVISGFLSLLGVIFIILTLYAGYNWMTAAGDEDKVTTAKETLQRAIIGLIITISSFAIWYFISTKII